MILLVKNVQHSSNGSKKDCDFMSENDCIKIKKHIADLICEYARNNHPKEFGAMLRIKNGVIVDLLFYPKSISGNSHMLIYDWEIPVGLDYDGTVHSHPSGGGTPSKADLEFFARHKRYHIIVCNPYTHEHMSAYDNRGSRIKLEFVD